MLNIEKKFEKHIQKKIKKIASEVEGHKENAIGVFSNSCFAMLFKHLNYGITYMSKSLTQENHLVFYDLFISFYNEIIKQYKETLNKE